VEDLCKAVAENFGSAQGVEVDPCNVVLCCGQSEAFAASILAGLCIEYHGQI
jgi:aspartate/methionine/tyrosine aminotransferase